MEISVINLGSSFDWRKSVEDIMRPLTAEGIASVLGIPEAEKSIADRLGKLRWIGLVSESFIEAQTVQSEWGEGTAYTNRWHGNPFEMRMGGCPESKYYMRPRQVMGGGVVEPFGAYTEMVRTYGASAYMKHCVVRISNEDSATLESKLPADIGDEPMILISPEMVCGLAYEMFKCLKPGEPRPDASFSEMFLRITLMHQLGHHLLPGDWADGNGVHVWEMLADHLCDSLLDDYERQWMFARSWLLHSSPYLSYFVPRILAAVAGSEPRAWINELVKQKLNIASHSSTITPLSGIVGESTLGERLMISPQMFLAVESLGKALRDETMVEMMKSVSPCAIGPFEEFMMPWRAPIMLAGLLMSRQPTLQLAAMDALETLRSRGEEVPAEMREVLRKWVDDNILSDSREVALRAWHCAEMDREEGRAERFRKAAKSKHSAIYTTVARRISENVGVDAIPLLQELTEMGSAAELRNCAVAELAVIAAKVGDNESIIRILSNADIAIFEKTWKVLDDSGYRISPWSLVRLLSYDCPRVVKRENDDDHSRRQREARESARSRMMRLAIEGLAVMNEVDTPGDIDMTMVARAVSSDREIGNILSDLLLHISDDVAVEYLCTLIELGGANGDAVAAKVIQARRMKDKCLLLRASEKDAVCTIRAFAHAHLDFDLMQEAFIVAAANRRVHAAYEIGKAAESAGPEWLAARYRGLIESSPNKAVAARFLGYVAYLSTINGWTKNVVILLENGADPRVTETSSGNTILHAASHVGDGELVEVLLQNGFDVSAKNSAGDTALIIAAEEGKSAVVSVFARYPDVLDNIDKNGRTALIRAAQKGHLEVVRILLDAGASPRINDRGRRNAAQRASESGHLNVSRAIIDFMGMRRTTAE